MRLRIVDVNFTDKEEWLFFLRDTAGNEVYILKEIHYKRLGKPSPVTRLALDQLDRGHWIDATVEPWGQYAVVTSFQMAI